jgi:hypothetical protein
MRIQDEIKFIIKPEILKRIGLIFIQKIQDRTAAGLDEKGEPFKAYSTNKFGMPSAAIPKRVKKMLTKNGQLTYYRRGGITFVLVHGGYAVLKAAMYQKTSYGGTVNLMQTGAMLRSMRVMTAGNNEITIGFGNSEDAAKAYYNLLMGREFLGVLPEDWDDAEIQELLASGVIIQ